MNNQLSFIEKQFPVSKVSKESYKERKAGTQQTLVSFGKWWGRKPLVLVRAAILGCLLPSTTNHKKDMDIFLKLMSMDNEGLILRKTKNISVSKLYEIITKNSRLNSKYKEYFKVNNKGKILLEKDAPKKEIEIAVFNTFGYDEKLEYCVRPEHLKNISENAWPDINEYLNTKAYSLNDLILQLSERRFGHNVVVGDCFCGGGSIPFEAARIGCDVNASDLNPIAGLLTWADLNIAGASSDTLRGLIAFQKKLYETVEKKVCSLGIETNERGDRAVAYLYCLESICPECGTIVPMSSSWLIGKNTKTVAKLIKNGCKYDIEIKMNASNEEMKEAEKGTVSSKGLECPCCGKTTPISVLRHDRKDEKGNIIYGLRKWEKNEFEARPEDVYHERLYAVKYEKIIVTEDGKEIVKRYYRAPNNRDLANEEKVHKIVKENFDSWQEQGLIPSMPIEVGDKTNELPRNRGWAFWHQLFNARQLLSNALALEVIASLAKEKMDYVSSMISIGRCSNRNSKLSRWVNDDSHITIDTFYNQALNTLFNYACRPWKHQLEMCVYEIVNSKIVTNCNVFLTDARNISCCSDFWITDPPYADAVNYHELSEFFLAWDKILLKKAFPDWYSDSKRVLAVRGDETFSQTMIEIYSNLAKHMPDNGMQVVMFTHSDPAVWAQLAVIMWKAGLKVTAAWNIATETDASGIKKGNYVKGTVLLVLRKQTGSDCAFLDEINADIKSEVKNQIDSMQKLDDKEEPNFSDPDYVLAAYAASLKVLTSYSSIEDLDLDFELNQAIKNPAGSKIVSIIENAKKIAYDCVIPINFESMLWKELTNAEKFYIKGLESEKHGDYQISTYQEFARGFSIGGYSQLMASEKANTARLKTPFELGARTINEIPDFEKSITRVVFAGIYAGIKDDNKPATALNYIKSEIGIGYWEKREMIKQILAFLCEVKDIDNMKSHWAESGEMAEMLLSMVTHDGI